MSIHKQKHNRRDALLLALPARRILSVDSMRELLPARRNLVTLPADRKSGTVVPQRDCHCCSTETPLNTGLPP